jgi:hypothetical protein
MKLNIELCASTDSGSMKILIIQTAFPLHRIGSAVGIATGYGQNNQGAVVRVPVGLRILTSPYHPDRLRGPPNHLSIGFMVLCIGG